MTERGRTTILVADDEPGVVRALTRILGANHRVLTATDGREAERILRKERVDLALVDVRMPVLDGFELLRRTKKVSPDTDLIMMTGSVTDTDQKLVEAIELGAFYFITKPFERSVLLTLVERCLTLRRLDHERHKYMEELQREMALARAFQRSLLPPPRARVGEYRIAAALEPTVDLSGDFFDHGVAGGRPWVFVTDVSGHGAGSAMVTGIVKAALGSALALPEGPAGAGPALRVAARSLGATDMFFTHFLAWVDGEDLRWVNAGHPDGLLLRGGRGPAVLLAPTEPLAHAEFLQFPSRTESTSFPRGSRLVLYSDGITEARNPQGEGFGLDRLRSLVEAGSSDDLTDRVLGSVRAFCDGRPQQDDYTVLVLQRT